MANFNELLQDYVNLDYEQLVAIGKGELSKMARSLRNYFDDTDYAAKALLMFTGVILGMDGKLSMLECRYLNELLDAEHSYDETCDMVSCFTTQEARDLVDNLIDEMDTDAKASALSVALCFCAVDETISREEVAYFKKLME